MKHEDNVSRKSYENKMVLLDERAKWAISSYFRITKQIFCLFV